MYSRGSGVTVCVGWRRLRARISDLALHSFQSPSPTEGQIGCGPESELASRGQRACRKTRETVRGERLLPQRGCRLTSRHRCHPWSCFRADSSCPSARSPAARGSCAFFARVHQASRRGRLAERSSTPPLRPRADRRCRWCWWKVRNTTPRAHLRTRGLVSAGRWSAAWAEEGTGHRPPAQAAAGARQRGGAVPPPRRPRMASPQGGGHRPPPARPPFPSILTCGTGSVTKTIGCSARQQLVEADEARSGVLSKLEVGEHT